MPTARRFEVSTFGVNDLSQGITTDPFGRSPFPTAAGLRVPSVLPGDTPESRPRYLFLLASRVISKSATRVRGLRQGLTIGVDASPNSTQKYPLTRLVTTPYWHFIDGNVSWHLVREPIVRSVSTAPTSDGASWAYTESNDPAMLYQRGTFSAAAQDPRTLQPIIYTNGMLSYVPPAPKQWQPIAGLGNLKDIRFPWHGRGGISNDIDEIVEGTCRVSLYASVLQTNPATRLQADYPVPSSLYPGALTSEEGMLASFPTGEGGLGPSYYSIFGAIQFEDIDAKVFGR